MPPMKEGEVEDPIEDRKMSPKKASPAKKKPKRGGRSNKKTQVKKTVVPKVVDTIVDEEETSQLTDLNSQNPSDLDSMSREELLALLKKQVGSGGGGGRGR